jgi:hypothetical protein
MVAAAGVGQCGLTREGVGPGCAYGDERGQCSDRKTGAGSESHSG